ncbi:MAG: hypothetical protein K2L81_03890 [Muribaculaceae bacterium]|nr:hypothetical protein [Muribaculaceae bacterium]
MKFTLAILVSAASLTLSGCGGWISTGVGGGYYPDDIIYSGPALPPPAPVYPLPPAAVYPYPGSVRPYPVPPPPGNNYPGNNRPQRPVGQPSYGNSGQGNRPMTRPAQSTSQGQGSGATRTH